MTRKTVASSISVSLISDGQSAPYYFQEYYAWSNVASTSDVTVSPFPEPYSGWKEEITTPTQGETYLWKKSVKYIWNDTARTYDQEQPRYYRLNGSEAYFADLDNEMDSIACDFDGVPLSTQSVDTSLSLWKGSTRMPVSAVTVFDSETSGATRVYYDNNIEKSGVTISWTIDTSGVDVDLTARFTSAATVFVRESRHLSLAIQLSYADIQRSVCFTINGVRPGVPGASPEIFSVVPSENQIVLQNNGTRVPTGMTCNVVKTVGNVTTTPSSSEYKLYRTIDGVLSTRTEINTSTVIQTSGVTKNILYEVEVGGTVLDKETVPLLKDGKDAVRRWIELTPTLVELDYNRKTLSAITPQVKFWKQTGDNTPVNVSSEDDINGFYCDGSIAGYTHVPGWIESGTASFDTTNNVWTFPTIPSGTVINNTLSVMWYSEHQTGSTRYDAEEMYLQIQGHNGDDGTSPIVADIDNEMDSVSCKANGEVDSEQTVTTKVSLYNGSNQVSSPTIIVRDTTSGGTAYTSGQRSGGVVVTWSNATGVISVTFKADSTPFTFTGVSRVFCIQIQANIGGETINRYLYFTVNGMRDGVLYKLLPSANVIKKTESSFFPERIHCEVAKIDGGVPVVPAANEYTLQYRIDETGNWTTTTSATTINANTITKNIQYQLKIQDGLADIETIPVVSDGNSSVIIDIDNDSDQFGTDIDSEVLVQQTVSTNVTMYEGASSVNFILTALTMTYEDGTSVPSDVAVCSGALNTSGTTHAVSVTIKQTSGTSRPLVGHTALHVRIEGQYEHATRAIVFTVGKVMSGKDGESPKIYQLELSSKSYAYGKNANNELVGNPSIKVRIKETVGNTSTIYGDSTVPTELPKFNWGFDNGSAVQTGLTAGTTVTIPATSASTHTNVWFQLTTGDKESVPILKDGNNGTDPIVIDIDNDSDLFGTDANSDVLVAQTFHTNVAMYQAITPLSFTISALSTTFEDGSSVGTNIATVSCYPSTGTANSFKVTAVIKQISGSTNPWATHSALHVHITGTYGTATTKSVVFTIGKVNAGGVGESPVIYQIALSSRSFSYTRSADNTLTGTSSIQVGVKKTIGNDSTIYNTATTGIPTFKWWFDNGSAVQTGLTAGTIVTIPAASADTHSHVSFQLESGSNDKEEVPILKGAFNGENGTSPYFADLDNEMDSMICDSNGNLNGEQSVTTNVALYYGQTKLTPSSIKVYRNNSEITSATTPWKVVVNVSTGNVVITGANGTPLGKEDFKIALTYNGQDYNVVMTVTGVRPGVNGESPVIPFLQPSVSCVTKHKDGTYSVSAVTCEALLRTANGVIPAPSGNATIYYSLDGQDVERYIGPILSTSFNETLQFNLMYNLSLADKETIPMIEDGVDGVTPESLVGIDIDNDTDIFVTDTDGWSHIEQEKKTVLTMQYGTLDVPFELNGASIRFADGTAVPTYLADIAITANSTNTQRVVTVTIKSNVIQYYLNSHSSSSSESLYQEFVREGGTPKVGDIGILLNEPQTMYRYVSVAPNVYDFAPSIVPQVGSQFKLVNPEYNSETRHDPYHPYWGTDGTVFTCDSNGWVSGSTSADGPWKVRQGADVPLTATCYGTSKNITFSLGKVDNGTDGKDGTDGETPIYYQLSFSRRSFSYGRNEAGNPTDVGGGSVTVNIERVSGGTITVNPATFVRFKWGYDNSDTPAGTDLTGGSTITVTPTEARTHRSVWVQLLYVPYTEKESLPLLFDGKPGANGTSFKAKGIVNWAYATTNYPTASSANADKTYIARDVRYPFKCTLYMDSWQWMPLSSADDGDAYTVEHGDIEQDRQSGSDASAGHLIMWSNEANRWVDLGKIQGDDGDTYYTHIAWAEDVTLLATPPAQPPAGQKTIPNASSVQGFSILPSGTSQWMGVLVDQSVPDSTNGTKYTWNKSKAENAILLSLDNEHEDFIYSAGNKVAPSNVTIQAHLYDGNSEVPASSLNWSIGQNKTIGINYPDVAFRNGLYILSGITAEHAELCIQAAYKGTTYNAIFTSNRISQDKYDIVVSPSSIACNPATYQTQTVSISAKKTDLTGAQTDATISTTTSTSKGQLRVFYAWVNSNGTKTSLTPLNALTISVQLQDCESYAGLYLELVLYKTSATYDVKDYETIEFAKSVNGSSGCAINVNKDKLNIVNDVDGYVSSAIGQVGNVRIKYMDGATPTRPDIYYNGTQLTSGSTTQVEKNLYVKLSTAGTDYQFIQFSTTSASGTNRLQLNGEQKTYTFTAKVTGKPDLDFSISIQGSYPFETEYFVGYLALDCSASTISATAYGRPPTDIPMNCWSTSIPTVTVNAPYLWRREESRYSNGQVVANVTLLAYYTVNFTTSVGELQFESDPSNRLLATETGTKFFGQLTVNGILQKIHLLCINVDYVPYDNYYGIEFYVTGGRDLSGNIVSLRRANFQLLNGSTNVYVNDKKFYEGGASVQDVNSVVLGDNVYDSNNNFFGIVTNVGTSSIIVRQGNNSQENQFNFVSNNEPVKLTINGDADTHFIRDNEDYGAAYDLGIEHGWNFYSIDIEAVVRPGKYISEYITQVETHRKYSFTAVTYGNAQTLTNEKFSRTYVDVSSTPVKKYNPVNIYPLFNGTVGTTVSVGKQDGLWTNNNLSVTKSGVTYPVTATWLGADEAHYAEFKELNGTTVIRDIGKMFVPGQGATVPNPVAIGDVMKTLADSNYGTITSVGTNSIIVQPVRGTSPVQFEFVTNSGANAYLFYTEIKPAENQEILHISTVNMGYDTTLIMSKKLCYNTLTNDNT